MKKILSIELGSTRIKAVLVDGRAHVLAKGIYDWENRLVNGLWSYPLEQALDGLAASYRALAEEYRAQTGEELTSVDAIGISAMMHGYLALDRDDRQVGIFQTWRNTHTEAAARELSELFTFNIPQRWSVAQYYQAVLNGEAHVRQAARLCTLSSYIHYRLTGRFVCGVGDASGMFPLDGREYDAKMLAALDGRLRAHGLDVRFRDLLPEVLMAGENAGSLTEAGARLLDPSGKLRAGAPLCPPEGDMQTNMVCSDTIAPGVASISAGTSCNIIVALDRPLTGYRPEIDVMSTPDGVTAAMVHSNNCTSEINAWVSLFGEVAELCGANISRGELFTRLFRKSLESDPDVGGNIAFNYLAGESIAGCETGALTAARKASGKLSLANFMQAQIFTAIGALSLGVDLLKAEGVEIRSATAAGGFYKTDFVGQNATSAVFGVPVTLLENAGEGGAWGMAILALFMLEAEGDEPAKQLGAFLDRLFADTARTTVMASPEDVEKYQRYFRDYKRALPAERLLAELLRE